MRWSSTGVLATGLSAAILLVPACGGHPAREPSSPSTSAPSGMAAPSALPSGPTAPPSGSSPVAGMTRDRGATGALSRPPVPPSQD
jgi:hypothetical protein